MRAGITERAAALLERHGALLGAVCFLVTQDRDDADGLLLDVLADAASLPRSPEDQHGERLRLLQFAARRVGRSVHRHEVAPRRPATLDASERSAIRLAMGELPPRGRLLLVLGFLVDLGATDLGTVLGTDPGAAWSELADVRNRLMDRVDELERHGWGAYGEVIDAP